jgi:aspartate 1-decarboxylase
VTRTLLRSKLHGAVVTDADPAYEGSITIDSELMAAADLAAFERVLVANVANGQRFETYVIAGPAGSRRIGLNGAAARLGLPGDRVIVMAWSDVEEAEVASFRPRVVLLDAGNRVREVRRPGRPD